MFTLMVALPLSVWSQPAAPKPEPPKADAAKPPEMPADVKALVAARSIKEPQKKIEALEKMIADHPKSGQVESARYEILTAILKEWPDQKDRILAQGRQIIDAGKDDTRRAALKVGVAQRLLDAGVLLGDAERLCTEALKAGNEKKYIEAEKKVAVEGKQRIPSDGELSMRFRQGKARVMATLANIQLKQGKQAKGEKLLRASYKLNASQAAVALSLADLADKKGKSKQALDYLVAARLLGQSTAAEVAKKLDAAYRKQRKGSADGLEEMLDAEYRKRYPPPIHPEPYKPTAARSGRVVLVEMFTGAGCPPCVAADLAFDAALERYDRRDLAVIVYHLHIPRPDPMTNEETQNRQKYYEVRGVPGYIIDGKKDGGGGPREYTTTLWDKVRPMIEKRLETPAAAGLDLEARMEGPLLRVRASARDFQTEAKELKIQVALVEEHIRYSGENGVRFHSMVVRGLGGPNAEGFAIDPARPASIEHTFDLKQLTTNAKKHLDDYEVNGRHGKIQFLAKLHEINASDLAVVAFVQDPKTQAILQAQYRKLGPTRISQAR